MSEKTLASLWKRAEALMPEISRLDVRIQRDKANLRDLVDKMDKILEEIKAAETGLDVNKT
jgi:hypothetical protein